MTSGSTNTTPTKAAIAAGRAAQDQPETERHEGHERDEHAGHDDGPEGAWRPEARRRSTAAGKDRLAEEKRREAEKLAEDRNGHGRYADLGRQQDGPSRSGRN